eukprot:TRINITY_DN3208_c0_g1_i7.p1 TRINITY_DN3208_c0_g1~~TRINITY_DN3208_c0_g1_i7.p1  ORF type:complete len:161 (+),score=55.18 TRINITY_DN3208_c0_g1_i7:412-894(+)
MPLGKEVKVMKCWRCGAYGHRTGDRECPKFLSGSEKIEGFLKKHEDPMSEYMNQDLEEAKKRVDYYKSILQKEKKKEHKKKHGKEKEGYWREKSEKSHKEKERKHKKKRHSKLMHEDTHGDDESKGGEIWKEKESKKSKRTREETEFTGEEEPKNKKSKH